MFNLQRKQTRHRIYSYSTFCDTTLETRYTQSERQPEPIYCELCKEIEYWYRDYEIF